MFISDIKWVIPAAIMSSDRLLNEDMNMLNAQSYGEDKYTILLQRAVFDFQPYTHTLLRNEDVEYAIDEWINDKQCVDLLDCLNNLFHHFLVWKGNCFEVKQEHLEEWLSFCSLTDPTWIIAVGYQHLIQQEILSDAEVIELVSENQCPVALPKASLNNYIADNHIHLGGHGSTALSMLNFAVYLNKKPDNNKINWPRRPENTLFESDKLSKNHLPLLINKLAESLGENIFKGSSTISRHPHTWGGLDSCTLNQSLLADLKRTYFDTSAQKLLASSHLKQQQSANRWLLFCIGLLEPTKHRDTCYQTTLNCFIRTSNILRNYMVVSGVGLGQFVEYFGFDHRKPKITTKCSGLEHKSHGIKYDNSPLTMREFRISPDDIVVKDDEYGFQLLPTSLEHLANMINDDNIASNSHFVIHFNRTYPNYKNRLDKHLHFFRYELKQQVEKIQQFSASVTYSDIELKSAHNNIDLRKLIRGYDVAGNENQLPIEIFAPTLRVLRAARYTTNGVFGKRLPQPFLTIHAGEDFSHIVSGLRAIDESIEFCKFTHGDRIGHGLALGINVKHWAQRQQRAYLTAGEHLDNLVWCHHQALSLIQINHTFQSALSLLEHKIRHWSSYLYGGVVYTPNDLYQSWMLRRNCPNQLSLALRDGNSEWVDWVPDIEFLKKESSSLVKKLWILYLNSGHLDLTSKRNDVISISCSIDDRTVPSSHNNKLSDNLSKSEIDLYEAIQDLLMERYSNKGIILEACPTSNLYIGRFKKYHEHPIFRWNPPNPDWLKPGEKFNRFGLRKGAVPVCVNTDDSGLMPTTIDNEHRVIKLAAIIHYNIGTCRAEEWITSIRQKGVDIFQQNHLN
ncbi:hypothetical protein VSAL_p840_57 (plasmid) [Aliivibrio salmonicida LFI1238]|uniref:Adenosine deaminase n=1 Tax=Aliivibrio salmonicida (strain LFI1238) TaxID=316275 RepID=B6ET28_ALISL|nr:antiviral RADAR system adenosine deaminase RdrB [Aliivibrio salmonicida]CAQ81916.1 hypothetical protein VSAL_p840_57 [Aliivibrio salmonicida LFI1238]